VYGAGVPGAEPVPGEKVALAYRKSVEGQQTGQSYRVVIRETLKNKHI